MYETVHDEENSSEAENDTSEDENVAEMQTMKTMGGKTMPKKKNS